MKMNEAQHVVTEMNWAGTTEGGMSLAVQLSSGEAMTLLFGRADVDALRRNLIRQVAAQTVFRQDVPPDQQKTLKDDDKVFALKRKKDG